MKTSWFTRKYEKSPSVKAIPLTEGCIIINPDTGAWAFLEPAEYESYQKGTLPDSIAEALFMRQLLKGKDGEIAEIEFLRPSEKPFVAVVNITNNCNLNCRYCFADAANTHSLTTMKDEVMEAIVGSMNRQHEELPVIYDLQGGEPLMFPERIKRFVNIAKEDSIVPYKIRMTTNGTLLDDDMIGFLKGNNIALSVSLDGTERMHNAHRNFFDNTGSFTSVWENIKKLKKSEIEFGVVVNLTRETLAYVEEMVEFMTENDITFKARPVNIFGRSTSQMSVDSEEYFIAYRKMEELAKKGRKKNNTISIFEKNALTPVRDYFCLRFPCGAGYELVNFNTNGDVYPCDGFKSDKTFCCGNIMESPLEDILQHKVMLDMRKRTPANFDKCGKCLYRGMCGPCAYSSYGKFGSIFREDPYCAANKKIFKYTIEKKLENNEHCP